jgi:hypothetical protein
MAADQKSKRTASEFVTFVEFFPGSKQADLDRLEASRYDIRQRLMDLLEFLDRQFNHSKDEHKRASAADDIRQICDWLCQPRGPLSADEKVQICNEISSDKTLSDQEREATLRRVLRSTGRPRGRPRTDTVQHAVSALTLKLTTLNSWREIALEVKGCKHKRPNPERSCIACGDAIRDAAGRLDTFLQNKNYHPNFPRRIYRRFPSDLSQDELERFFPSNSDESDE